MVYICHYCSKSLCSKQRLDSHIRSFHREPEDEEISLSPQDKIIPKNDDIPSDQCGGGYGDDVSINDEESVNDEDVDESSSSDESDNDTSVADESDESCEHSNDFVEQATPKEDIFDLILEQAQELVADTEDKATQKDLQRAFRRIYKDLILKKQLLNKSKHHKRIMKTVKEVRDRHEDFSFEEALDEGLRLRRRMLDEMVPAQSDSQDDTDDDGMCD